MKRFSVIVPVFNRPQEVKELLESLVLQKSRNFELIIVEDGSSVTSQDIVKAFEGKLDLKYFYKPNSGPGQSRNFGVEKASEDFFVFLDSDCIVPENYFSILTAEYQRAPLDCFGGIDKSHTSFTPVQKAIDFSMTSFITTGGIRGGAKKVTKFYPRSFNMGFSREVYNVTGGYSKMRFGEDIDLSIRIEKAGFELRLINEAFVYHKRRTDFYKFFKQIFNSGRARIDLFKLYPESLKITHLFPLLFILFVIFSIFSSFIFHPVFILPLVIYLLMIFVLSTIKSKDFQVGILSISSTIIQMFAYGIGFLKAVWERLVLKKDFPSDQEFSSFNKKFYK